METIKKHHLTGTNIESSFGKEKEVANTYIDYCMLMRPWLWNTESRYLIAAINIHQVSNVYMCIIYMCCVHQSVDCWIFFLVHCKLYDLLFNGAFTDAQIVPWIWTVNHERNHLQTTSRECLSSSDLTRETPRHNLDILSLYIFILPSQCQ